MKKVTFAAIGFITLGPIISSAHHEVIPHLHLAAPATVTDYTNLGVVISLIFGITVILAVCCPARMRWRRGK